MQTDTPNKPARTMLRVATMLLVSCLTCGPAIGQYVPPDRYGDEHKGSDVLRKNMGQVFGTDGHKRKDIKAYFEGSPLGIYLRDSSRVSFTYSLMYADSAIADTTYRVDMLVGGPAGAQGSGSSPVPPHQAGEPHAGGWRPRGIQLLPRP